MPDIEKLEIEHYCRLCGKRLARAKPHCGASKQYGTCAWKVGKQRKLENNRNPNKEVMSELRRR